MRFPFVSTRHIAVPAIAFWLLVVSRLANAAATAPPFMGGTLHNARGQTVGTVSLEQTDETPAQTFLNVEILGRAGFAHLKSTVLLLDKPTCVRSANDVVLADMPREDSSPPNEVQVSNGSAVILAGTLFSFIGRTVMVYAHGGRHRTYCTKLTHPMR